MSFVRPPSPAALARARATLEAARVSEPAHPTIPLLADTWQQMAAVCADLTDAQWLLPTDCPGWTVADQMAHIIGTERTLLGHPLPRDPVVANHVRNELGAFNEAWVEHYRGWMGGELLQEFSRITGERLDVMALLTPSALDMEILSPIGIVPMSRFLAIRVLDSFQHEQDIRRALGRPGHLDSPTAEYVVEMLLRAMPKQVAHEAHAADGSTVVFDIEGFAGARAAVRVDAGRGVLLDEVPVRPSVLLDMDVETFLRLCCGRINGARALEQALVGIDGDVTLGRAVLGVMTVSE